ncbi:hypothetical protein SDJN02_16743, partial [Cucurbita argyrosperma subsp. argyrosperma]
MIIRLVPNAKALTWGCIISGTDGGRVKLRQCDDVLVRKRGGCQTRFMRRVLGWGNRGLMMKPKIIEQRNQSFLAPQYTAAQCRRRWRRALLTEQVIRGLHSIQRYVHTTGLVGKEELKSGKVEIKNESKDSRPGPDHSSTKAPLNFLPHKQSKILGLGLGGQYDSPLLVWLCILLMLHLPVLDILQNTAIAIDPLRPWFSQNPRLPSNFISVIALLLPIAPLVEGTSAGLWSFSFQFKALTE